MLLVLAAAPAEPREADPSWTAVARSAMPAVVNISSSKVVRERGPFFNDPVFRFFFEGPGTTTRRERSLGSGVIVSSDGYLLTNNHVVENAQEIRVALGDRREFKARLIGTDPKTDLAVLRLPGNGFPVLRLGDSDRSRWPRPCSRWAIPSDSARP